MKTIFLAIICMLIISGCKKTNKDEVEKIVPEKEAIKFVDAHLQKIINKEYDLAYEDYMDGFKNIADVEKFESIFEQDLKNVYGELKSAEFKMIFYGKTYTIGGVLKVADLYYKADIDRPETYAKVTITKIYDEIKVVHISFVNFPGGPPPEMK